MAIIPKERRSLLSSQARIQAPWVKVTIGSDADGYTFGVFTKTENKMQSNSFYSAYNITYPNFVQRISITKINGQINQYTLNIKYPIRPGDDPNFFEKVFSKASGTRRIVFSYGDSSMPTYCYKDEEAIITGITQQFDLEGSTIAYTVKAVSGSVVAKTGSFSFPNSGFKKPSDEIKNIFRNPTYGLRNLFRGMTEENIDALIASDDKYVKLETKTNISPLDYILYLVSCMVPAGSDTNNLSRDIYVLTIHDDTIYDTLYNDTLVLSGPYFKVSKMTSALEHADAYEVDIGFNTSTIVTSFNITNDENYSIYYNYNTDLMPKNYTRRLNNDGTWEDIYAPMFTSKNEQYITHPDDITWFSKLTKYPISATLKIQGLLRPATLMQYLRLNVIFPGGNKHISSGLYIVTKQLDEISENGYTTTLSVTRISS